MCVCTDWCSFALSDVTVSGSDLSDGSDEEEMDNYNSAGEEIEEDDFDDIQNDFSPKDDMELEDDIPDDSLEGERGRRVICHVFSPILVRILTTCTLYTYTRCGI